MGSQDAPQCAEVGLTMKVTHITEEMALKTTHALLMQLPEDVRKDRTKLPALAESWVVVMTTEFGYRWHEGFGMVIR